ncbi:MAG TPA: VOC family protein [Mycobacteriales bacterium]|nr:VOC family protein [Mycobacteriales bacterium]
MADEEVTPSIVWRTLSIECADADATAEFYSHLLGWEVDRRGDVDAETGRSGWVTLRNPERGPVLAFGAKKAYVPPVWPQEQGEQAMMMHFEVGVDDVEASVAQCVRAGGSVASWQPPDRDPAELRVMLDPAGHPLCLFRMDNPRER